MPEPSPPSREPSLADLPRPRAVVFDKDGTLIDADARWYPLARAFVDALADGEAALTRRLEEALGVGPGRLVTNGPAQVAAGWEIRELAMAELTAHGLDRDKIEARMAVARTQARSSLGPLVALGPVAAALGRLADAGVQVAVATTDDREPTRRDLAALAIDGLVTALRCGDDEGPIKPDPRVLLDLLDGWDLGPADCWFVGDSERDQTTAAAAGVPFVAVTADGRPASWAPGSPAIATVAELARHLVP